MDIRTLPASYGDKLAFVTLVDTKSQTAINVDVKDLVALRDKLTELIEND